MSFIFTGRPTFIFLVNSYIRKIKVENYVARSFHILESGEPTHYES